VDVLLVALGPALAAGMGLQRLLEILDGPLERLVGQLRKDRTPDQSRSLKRLLYNLIAVGVGIALAAVFRLRVLRALGTSEGNGWLDIIVTGFIVSTGTEGINSIVKFLGYKKEEKKAEAAASMRANEEPDAAWGPTRPPNSTGPPADQRYERPTAHDTRVSTA
jgi:hypothetical protein